jgi:hypothetical protein
METGAERQHEPALVGRTIGGRFDVLAFARAGGMGYVYRAHDRTTGTVVAIKVLAPTSGDAERFAREAALLSKVEHPGVVRYVGHGMVDESSGDQYLAMEWLEGEDLGDRLAAKGTLSVEDTVLIAQRVAAALAAAHRAGIIHRDLKPANVFLVGGHIDAPKLLDFGVARIAAASELTAAGTLVGTPAYMAPEMVRGDAVGAAADVYGVGALMFRCLAGRAPFVGAHQLAVLAKVVVEPAAAVRDLRHDVAPAVSELVARLLSKDSRERPVDGAALEAELAELTGVATNGGSSGESSDRRARVHAAISAREQRVACVVLCASGATPQEITVAEDAAQRTEDEIHSAIITRGGVLDRIAKGACIVTIPHAASAAEQAARAARCALALAAVRPGTPIFVATGRVIVTGEGRVGEVIDRAAAALVAAQKDGRAARVHVDAATYELLDGRFRMRADPGDGDWRILVEEDEDAAPIRTLLGRPAQCLGRDAQIAMLDALLAACRDDSRAGAALVVGEPGLGKTHLVNELLRRRGSGGDGDGASDIDLLVAKGDPMRAASAFGVAAQLFARAAGIRDADSAEARAAKLAALVERDFDGAGSAGALDASRLRELRELLGEICSVPTPPALASASLRAARADAAVMADALRDAWVAWMKVRVARAAPATLVIWLEDVHWADIASLRWLETAATELADRALLVLATARPEGSAAFAERWKPRGLVEITLGPIGSAAAERLVKSALGKDTDVELVRTICGRAGGHPFLLEELVRAVADGRGADALPDSVLGMMQARLDHLGAGARQVVRAASVFGETWSKRGVLALFGDEMTDDELRAALTELSAQEMIIEERGKEAQPGQLRFRHMLLRDAAYATLADVDRVRAHRRAAEWLEQRGELDPAVLGEHYYLGDVKDRACELFHRAAAQAISRNDFERAQRHAERALALGPDVAAEAALRGIEAEILYWRGEIVAAADRAPSAVARLERGTQAWLDAVSVAVGALGQLGRNDEVAALLRDAAHVSTSPACRGAHVVALSRGMTQLFWAHARADLGDVRARLEALVADGGAEPLDAYQLGWVHRVRAESAFLHERDVSRCLDSFDASCAAFESVRAIRPLSLSRLNAASLVGWAGAPARGLELVRAACADAERVGAGFLIRYGGAVEGLLLAYSRHEAAAASMERALAAVAGSPRLAFICHMVLGSLALDRNDIDAGAKHADAANALAVVDDLKSAGLALASRAVLARFRSGPGAGASAHADEAVRLALAGTRMAAGCTDLELTFGLAELALAEAHLAQEDRAAAADAIAPVARAISAIASTIADDAQRTRFLERPIANDRIVRLARELAVG